MIFRAIAVGAVLLAGGARAVPVPPAVASLFPTGPGHDTTLRICSTCHSPEIAARQRLNPEAWKAVVGQMAGLGAPGTDAELAEIATYLATSFPEPAK